MTITSPAGPPRTTLRYIDTSGLPDGFDVGDLIAQGVTGDALVAWCKGRVRPGIPPPEARPEVVRPKKTPASGAAGGGQGEPVGETNDSVAECAPVRAPVSTVTEAPLAPVVEGNVVALRPVPVADAEALDLPPEFSDDSLAKAFTEQYAPTFRYVANWGRWLQWDGARWSHDNTLRAQHTVRLVLRDQANEILRRAAEFGSKTRGLATAVSSARTLGAVERLARADPKHSAAPEQFDADEWVLNTPAGIVDLRTGALRPATMSDFCTKVTRVAPGGDCPTWRQFLADVTDGDVDMQAYLQRVAGYALTGSTREHALFFFYGTGRNGKGTFLNTLEWIVGDYSRVASMDVFTEAKNERHPTELAALMGARMVTSQETDEGKRWAEARIKAMTGSDPITARFMRQDEFTYTPQFKLMISGNHRPGLRNIDEAMKARLHLIPFTITVPPEKRDPALPEKLRAEAGGILQWMIEGCQDWVKNRLQPPDAVRQATDEYFASQDVVQQWIDEECLVDPTVSELQKDLYRNFSNYANANNEYPLPRKRWKAALEKKGIQEGRASGGQIMRGLRLIRGYDSVPVPDDLPL